MGIARLKHGRLKSVTLSDKRGEVIERYEAGIIHDHRAPVATPRSVGLGDLVATFAQPIAALVDSLTDRLLSASNKTALAGCGACARRHRKLNLICPDILTCPALGEILNLLPSAARTAIVSAAKRHIKGL